MFWNAMNGYGYTENGAFTHTTTGAKVLDMFAMGGAMRERSDEDIVSMFSKAFKENPVLATKCLFYLRDCRGGAGEKRFFRIASKWLSETYEGFPVSTFIDLVAEYGSWKDIFSTFSVDFYADAVKNNVIRNMTRETPTLMEKYMPSIGGSKNAEAEKLAGHLGMTPREYRKYLSASRAKLDVVETKMSSNRWDEIKYSGVPSKAMLNYAKAFNKHDGERITEYFNKVDSGEEKINTGTLFPYEIFRDLNNDSISNENATTIWNNLKDYTNGKNAIVVADTSGSMWSNKGLPLFISTSLALYFAERNKGKFHGSFITFSDNPGIVNINESLSLRQKMAEIMKAPWGGTTNLIGVFDLILSVAINEALPQEEMPETIYIISDMEFNEATEGSFWGYYRGKGTPFKATNFQVIKKKYEDAGYGMPNIIFWNANSHQDNVPVKKNEAGVVLVSGSSPSAFKLAVSENCSPESFMLETLMADRYKNVEKLFEGN